MLLRYVLLLLYIIINSQSVAHSETVRVYGNSELYPIHFIDKDGKVVGYWVDVLDEISRRTDMKFTQKLTGVRQGHDKIVRDGERALLGLVLTSAAAFERYQDFDFSKPLGEFNLRFYSSSQSNISWIDLRNLPKKIAVIGRPGAFAKGWLERNSDAQIEFLEVDSFEDGLRKVLTSEADAFFGAEWAARFAYTRYFKSNNGIIEGPVIFSSKMALATNSSNRDLISLVNQVVDQSDFPNFLLKTYLKWLPRKPLSPNEYVELQRHKQNDIILLSLASILLIVLMAGAYFVRLKYKQKTRLERIARLSIRSTLHDLADPLNALIFAKPTDKATISNANEHIKAMMQYHRILLNSGSEQLNSIATCILDPYLRKKIDILNIMFPVSIQIDFVHVEPTTVVKTNLDALSIILHNVVKNAYQHGAGDLQIEVKITQSKVSELEFIASNQIVKRAAKANTQNDMTLESQSFKHGLSIISDTVQLADGYAFHRKKNDQFIMQFRLPAVILDQRAAKPRSPKKLQISKASLFVIIDDSEYTLAALASQLTDLGFRYSTLSSKDQFFEFCGQNAEKITDNFIFLVDKNLRSVSGVELVKILIDKFNVSASNVIMMSGDIMHFEDEIELNVPQDVLKLSKPLNLNDHIEVIS